MSLDNDLQIQTQRIDLLDNSYTNLQSRVDLLDDGNNTLKSWLAVSRLSNDYQNVLNKLGVKVSKVLSGTSRPGGLKLLPDGRIAITDYYGQTRILSRNFNLDYILPVTYQSPSSTNTGMGYSFGVDLNSGGFWAIASWARHCVRVYNSVGDLLYTIGIPGSAGDVADGKLRNPRRAVWLPNGNLAICSYYGKGDGATNHGHISEYSSADGSFIATRLGFYGNGQSAIASNILYRPIDFKLDKFDSSYAWISEYGRNRILKINIESWLIEDIFYAPTGYTFENPWSICTTTDNQLCVASLVQQGILVIDIETKEFRREIKPNKFDTGFDIRDIEEIEPGYLAYSEWGASAIAVCAIAPTIEIPFEEVLLPPESTINSELVSNSFNLENSIYTLEVDCQQTVPQKILIPYEKEV